MSTETWSEERARLLRLLDGIESGEITHINEGDLRELQETNDQNVAALKARLAELNDRLGAPRNPYRPRS